MTSRDRVLASFAQEEPDRVPAWCGASPEFIAKAKCELNIPSTEEAFVRFVDDFRRFLGTPYLPGRKLTQSILAAPAGPVFRVSYGSVG